MMRVLHLSCRGFPQAADFSADVSSDLVLLRGENAQSVLRAVDAVTGGADAPALPCGTSVSAEVETESGIYRVTAEQGEVRAVQGGGDATAVYRRLIEARSGEGACRRFPADGVPFAARLGEYLTAGGTPDAREIGSPAFFHGCLRAFMRQYRPACLPYGKELFLLLSAAGEFRTSAGHGRPICESERIQFELMCFLQLQELWSEYKAMQDIHAERQPLLIAKLGREGDAWIDPLLGKLKQTGRQVFAVLS